MTRFNDMSDNSFENLLDDAFASRPTPSLSPSVVEVRRRARRRRQRTRAVGVAAAACVGVGGIAALANGRKPSANLATGASTGFGDDPCAPVIAPADTEPVETAPATTVEWNVPSTTPAALSLLPDVSTTDPGPPDVVVTDEPCAPTSGYRCVGEAHSDGEWTYFDYCEPVAVTTSTVVDTAPADTFAIDAEGVYIVQTGDYLFGIAEKLCIPMEGLASWNGWPDGINHTLYVGDEVRFPGPGCGLEATTTTLVAPTMPDSIPVIVSTPDTALVVATTSVDTSTSVGP
jgi:LysM repeat protein